MKTKILTCFLFFGMLIGRVSGQEIETVVQAGHFAAVTATCYSPDGNFISTGSSVEVLAMRGATEEKALAQLSRSSGVHVMASSERDQQSAEIKSLGHGVFTCVLLEALKGKADGAPADSKITVYEIKSYIDDQVPEISYNLIRHRQFPSTFSIGHDFPISLF